MFRSEVFGKEPHGGLVLSDRNIHMDVRYFPFLVSHIEKKKRCSLLYLTYFVEYSKDCCQEIIFFL